MEKLEEIISVVLTERKPQLASSSFESLHFYCNQLSQMASKMYHLCNNFYQARQRNVPLNAKQFTTNTSCIM